MQGTTRRAATLFAWLATWMFLPWSLAAQERGANALGELVEGLGVTARVLVIGAHPDDEDTFLITWLQRGRHVETAYLSLTRGDGGQNLIGNELGEALGVLRTEELLAARRIDGARQYFTRAYDFGFSKDTIDTYRHWPRDTILGDVIRVVREFRPHVIVAVFSGTPRDGHGHHQVSGLLARAAYDESSDTARFPARGFGASWTVLKFYRAARGSAQAGTLGVNVGEYSPLLGRSFGEIAGESRSQHKSQGFGALQRKGLVMNFVRREATRVNEATTAGSERSLFDGIDTTWARFKPIAMDARVRAVLDSIPASALAVRQALDPYAPDRLIAPLLRLRGLVATRCLVPCDESDLARDLEASVRRARSRTERALWLAAGVSFDAITERELVPAGRPTRVITSAFNRGRDTVTVRWSPWSDTPPLTSGRQHVIPPGDVAVDTVSMTLTRIDEPPWLRSDSRGSTGSAPFLDAMSEMPAVVVLTSMETHGLSPVVELWMPASFRYADPVRGEQFLTAAVVPLLDVSLEGASSQFAIAGSPVDREVRVQVRAGGDTVRDVRVTLTLAPGLTVDSAVRMVPMVPPDRPVSVAFRVRGRLAAGIHRIEAQAQVGGTIFARGCELIDYDHIRRQRVYHPATIQLTAVDVRVTPSLRVAYVPGVGDNVAPGLSQLGIPTTVLPATELARADLSRYTTVVVGPRAYEANPELAAANPRLFDWVRRGGTLVVQYGQYEMAQPRMTPYPLAINRPHDRVTQEDAPVTMLDPTARELTWPNRITAADFDGWVQERSLYMPRTFDEHYRPLLSMSDPGEPPGRGAILVATLGRGTYIYTSLAFFRQLPAGVPGAARLFVNLVSAGLPAAAAR